MASPFLSVELYRCSTNTSLLRGAEKFGLRTSGLFKYFTTHLKAYHELPRKRILEEETDSEESEPRRNPQG